MTGQELNLPVVTIEKWEPEERGDSPKVILVYGHSGVGKTVFASTWPEPLLIDIDRGRESIRRTIDYATINTWQDLKNIFITLKYGEHPYKTVILDTLNGIQDLSMTTTLQDYPTIKRAYEGVPAQGDYRKVLADFYNLVQAFTKLPMNVVLIARAGVQEYETDFIKPHFIGKATASQITSLCDIIGYMDRKTVVNNETKEEKVLPTINFNELQHVSKDRTWQLPPYIVAPEYEHLANHWRNK